MASLDEFNPGRWEAEDEDFLDREDNYVLEKSTSQVVTNVTAKTRRSRILNQHANGKPSTRMTKQPSHKREPPSFASAKANLRKTPPRRGSATNHSKRSSPSSKLKSANLKQHASAPVQTTTVLGTSSEVSAAAASNQKTLEPVVSNRTPVTGAPPSKTRQVPSGVSDDASVESEESLDIKQVFPVLDEKPKPPSPSDPHWKSQQIYIPVKQEKWNEASVMRMHQSMMAIPTRRQSYESPYMKELQFDDDDKSLDIADIFPVLKENGTNPKKTPLNKPSASGPAILQAARQAYANKRWRTAGNKIAAARKAPAAERAKPPEPPTPPAAPIQPAKHLPPPPTTTTAAATQQSPMAQGTGKESQSSNEGKKGYDMPTHISRPSAAEIEAGMHASDELTMDSALLKSGSGQNLKEQEKEQTRELEKEKVQQQQQQEQEEQERAAAKLERKLSKRSKKDSKSHKKKKKKSSRRQLKDGDLNSVSSHTEVRRSYERETSLGPESLMERQEAEAARRRLKKEKKEKKKHKKHKKKQKRQAQSERLLSNQTSPREEEEPGRLTRSMPEIKESQSSSPHASTFAPEGMAESQPAIASKPALDNYLEGREGTSKSLGRSRRSVQSTPTMSSRQSDSKMTTKSDGDIVRAKSSRTRKAAAYYDEQEEDGVLDSYIQGDKQKSALSSKVSVRSQSQTSHTTVKKSNVVKKKDSPPSYSQSAAETDSLKMDADVFMRSAAAGLLYEEEDSLSSGAAAAERRRVRAARDESRRAVDSSSRLGGNSALKPSGPRKEPLDKNKQQAVAPKTSVRKSSSTRPTVLDNAQMNSVGNFDMMSAVDAAVEAKKAEKQGQGRSTAEKTPSSKKKGLLRRIFSVRDKSPKKPKKPKGSKKPTVRSRSAVPQSAAQEELNDYLSSSKSSWFESATQEKQEVYSAPSSSNDVDLQGSLKCALGPPPMESNRSNRLGTSLPHESSARRRR